MFPSTILRLKGNPYILHGEIIFLTHCAQRVEKEKGLKKLTLPRSTLRARRQNIFIPGGIELLSNQLFRLDKTFATLCDLCGKK